MTKFDKPMQCRQKIKGTENQCHREAKYYVNRRLEYTKGTYCCGHHLNSTIQEVMDKERLVVVRDVTPDLPDFLSSP